MAGFNSLLQEQQSIPGDCSITVVTFYTDYKAEFYETIHDCPGLMKYNPTGRTALNDTFCKVLDAEGKRMTLGRSPDKVICCVITDGLENASVEYSLEDVNKRIQHQREKYGWEFTYIGAGFDGQAEAENYGIPNTHSISVTNDSMGHLHAHTVFSNSVANYRHNPNRGYKGLVEEK